MIALIGCTEVANFRRERVLDYITGGRKSTTMRFLTRNDAVDIDGKEMMMKK